MSKLPDPPAPPIDPWERWKTNAKNTIEEVEIRTAESVVSLIGHWSHWKSVTGEIWGQMKEGASQVLSDLLYEFEHRFIKGLIASMTTNGGGFTSAFAGMFGVGGGGAAAGGGGSALAGGGSTWAAWGAAAGSTWALAFTGVGLGLLAGWGIDKAVQGRSPEHQTGIEQTEYDRRYNTPAPNTGLQNSEAGQGVVDATGTMAGWVAGDSNSYANPYDPAYQAAIAALTPAPGFARGTPRLDFASFGPLGQLATLHADEAVIPRGGGHQLASEIAAALPSGAGTVVNLTMDFRNAVLPDRASLEAFASKLITVLPGQLRIKGLA